MDKLRGYSEVSFHFHEFHSMDERDLSTFVVSPAHYIPYFNLVLDHLVSTSIDAYGAIITAHLPPDTPSAESIITMKLQQQTVQTAQKQIWSDNTRHRCGGAEG